MPTVFTHPALPLALSLGLGRYWISGRLLALGIFVSILPDLDVLAFRFGISYGAEFGHRGFSHSLFFALGAALLGACFYRLLHCGFLRAFIFLALVTASHAVLDAFTNGGLGVALFWPWSAERFFAPIKEIEVSPLAFSRFLAPRGWAVLKSEFMWVWLPLMSTAIVAAIACYLWVRRKPPVT
ncbi:MAG: inner rane protein ybcI [Proteobacteria bacterium]|nr:inner rane protein ybcI [Pseudomonadota bacterium]